MFFTRKKKYVQSESGKMLFHVNDMSNKKSHSCVSFAPKFQPFTGAFSLQSPRFAGGSQTFKEKSFSRRVFRVKK